MNARRALIVVVLALAGIFAWLLWPDRSAKPHRITLARPAGVFPAVRTSVAAAGPDQTPPEARSELADQLNAPNATIQGDLRVVQSVIEAYRSNFHENPIGTNTEITAALTGRNRLLLALIPSNHPAINLKGELCDRWGRPFFFHQLSGTQMEIRSSGPDKTMWTEDDAVLTPN
ncbi:MAG: hypothetical protein JWM35_2583 [Verrucomicrobia bacterium]|nr:hypothetical protein [Verrucomicrobiota bacterium]